MELSYPNDQFYETGNSEENILFNPCFKNH